MDAAPVAMMKEAIALSRSPLKTTRVAPSFLEISQLIGDELLVRS